MVGVFFFFFFLLRWEWEEQKRGCTGLLCKELYSLTGRLSHSETTEDHNGVTCCQTFQPNDDFLRSIFGDLTLTRALSLVLFQFVELLDHRKYLKNGTLGTIKH